MRWAMTRPSTSVGPPAAKGTIMVIGLLGKFCADAAAMLASSATKPAADIRFSIHVLLDCRHHLRRARVTVKARAMLVRQIWAAYESCNSPRGDLRHDSRRHR